MPSPSLKRINREAGTNFKRWREVTEAVKVEWHPQIHRPTAQKEGLTPADFTWLNYPVSNVTLRHPEYGESSRWNIRWTAQMPPDTPQLNFYEEDGTRRPEPRGSALARVVFALIDVADGETLLRDTRVNHFDGAIEGGLTEGGVKLWERMKANGYVEVRLEAQPFFFPYNDPDKGDGGNHYSAVNNGYLNGDTATSPVYMLNMGYDHAGNEALLIDGEPKPGPAPLRGPAEGEAFHVWLSRERQAITAQDAWVTPEIIAGQLPGTDLDRYNAIEAGTVTPEDWERHNIEDAIKGWQQVYG